MSRFGSLCVIVGIAFLVASSMTLRAENDDPAARQKALAEVAAGNELLDRAIEGKYNSELMAEAIKKYDKALDLDFRLVEANFNKGIALIWRNRGSQRPGEALPAVNCFYDVLNLKPESPEALFCIGQAYFYDVCLTYAKQSHPREYEEAKRLALEAFEKVILRFPKSPEAELAKTQIADVQWHDTTDLVTAIKRPGAFVPIYRRKDAPGT